MALNQEFHKCPTRVSVRVRPFSQSEHQHKAKRIISVKDNHLYIANPEAFDADVDAITAAGTIMNNSEWSQSFSFDHILWSLESTGNDGEEFVDQEGVYRAIGCEIVENVLSGVSASCFAYGHTGTGKTFSYFGNALSASSWHRTEEGDDFSVSSGARGGGDSELSARYLISDQSGLVPRVITDVIDGLKQRDDYGKDTVLTMSIMEIYNEKIRDLLLSTKAYDEMEENRDSDLSFGRRQHQHHESNSPSALRVREHPQLGTYVPGLKKQPINDSVEALQCLFTGYRNRTTSHSHWNTHSSRSHALVVLELSPKQKKATSQIPQSPQRRKMSPSPVKRGNISNNSSSNNLVAVGEDENPPVVRLQMVDLAGSEKDSQDDANISSSSSSGAIVAKGKLLRPQSTNALLSGATELEKTELRLIRRSLSTLGYIIKELARGTSHKQLPYRDSVLTYLLRDALNGKNFTSVLATLSPADSSFDESLYTLKFASRLCSRHDHGGGLDNSFISDNHSTSSGLLRAHSEEFSKLKQDLAGNRNSAANRQYLKNLVSDPQQRLAKLGGPSSFGDHSNRSNQMGISLQVSGDAAKTIEDLSEANRVLQLQFVELQIELDTARADKTTALIDLQAAREALQEAEIHSRHSVRSAIAEATNNQYKSAPREVSELRQILARKEEALDRLLIDLRDEKSSKLNMEKIAQKQAEEFLERVNSLQQNADMLTNALDRANADFDRLASERQLHLSEIDKLRSALNEENQDNNRLQGEIQQQTSRIEAMHLEIAKLNSSLESTNAALKNKENEFEHLHSDSMTVAQERDSLLSLSEQQNQALKMQAQQAESQTKMLNQRQQSLERLEKECQDAQLAMNSLQDSLQGLLSQEGYLLQSELLDTQRLVAMIVMLKERLSDEQHLKIELEESLEAQNRNQQEIQRLQEHLALLQPAAGNFSMSRVGNINDAASMLADKAKEASFERLNKQLQAQVVSLRQAAEANEAKAAYWQTIAEAGSNSPMKSLQLTGYDTPGKPAPEINRVLMENHSLQIQLAQAQAEIALAKQDAKNAKEDLQKSQESMQREFSSLWMAVQELNKLDAIKEKGLMELLADRDEAVKEKKEALRKLDEMSDNFHRVQRDLQAIDRDLLSAAAIENLPVPQSAFTGESFPNSQSEFYAERSNSGGVNDSNYSSSRPQSTTSAMKPTRSTTPVQSRVSGNSRSSTPSIRASRDKQDGNASVVGSSGRSANANAAAAAASSSSGPYRSARNASSSDPTAAATPATPKTPNRVRSSSNSSKTPANAGNSSVRPASTNKIQTGGLRRQNDKNAENIMIDDGLDSPYIESLLEDQIAELSGYLDADKARSSAGFTSSGFSPFKTT